MLILSNSLVSFPGLSHISLNTFYVYLIIWILAVYVSLIQFYIVFAGSHSYWIFSPNLFCDLEKYYQCMILETLSVKIILGLGFIQCILSFNWDHHQPGTIYK